MDAPGERPSSLATTASELHGSPTLARRWSCDPVAAWAFDTAMADGRAPYRTAPTSPERERNTNQGDRPRRRGVAERRVARPGAGEMRGSGAQAFPGAPPNSREP